MQVHWRRLRSSRALPRSGACSTLAMAVGLSLAWAPALWTQSLVASPEFLDGGSAPGGIGILDNLDRPNVNAAGVLAFTADLIGTVSDDLIVVDGAVLAREGDSAPSVPGGAFGNFDAFRTHRQINAAGDAIFICSLTGVPTTANQCLYVNLQLFAREGDAAPGIAGRNFEDFEFAAIADDGMVIYRADLDGSAFDRAIYRGFTPLAREGESIVGTDFDGFAWDEGLASFALLTANGPGDLLFVGDTTDPNLAADVGLFRISGGVGVLELLLREGETVLTASGLAAISTFDALALADNGDWLIRASIDTSADTDQVVIGSFGGAGPTILLQEGASLAGASIATVGNIQGIAVNSTGHWLALAEIVGGQGTHGLFLDGALVLATQDPVVGTANAVLTGIGIDQLVLTDTNEIFFEGTVDDGTVRDGIFRAVTPTVAPVANIACNPATSGVEIDVGWTIPIAANYDGIRVLLDGVLVADLVGSASGFTTPAVANGSTPTICVQPYLGADSAPARCCSVFALVPPDFEACRLETPPSVVAPLTTYLEIVTIAATAVIDEVELSVNIDHSSSFLAGIAPLELSSPQATTVRLHDGNGSGPSLRAIYSDSGRPNGVPFEAGDLMQPTGPGSLSDFQCQDAAGTWTLRLSNASSVSTPIVEDWCVRIFERTISCIEPIQRLVCSVAPSGDRFDLTWQLPATRVYDTIRIVLDSVTVVDIPGTATAFQTPVVPSTGEYAIGVIGIAGGVESDLVACNALIVVPADFEVCSVPPSPVVVAMNSTYVDTVSLAAAVRVRAVQVTVDVDHTTGFIAGIDPLEVTSPAGTTVRLHDGNGAVDPAGLHTIYADGGRVNGPPFSAGDPMQPTGPGMLSDFACEVGMGVWTYRLTNSSSLSQPIQQGWCLGVFEETDPTIACCEAPTELTCDSQFCSTGDVALSWTSPSTYTLLELVREVNGIETIIALLPTATSTVDLRVPGGQTYTYRLRAQCSAAGPVVESEPCEVPHGVPPVGDFACLGDVCTGSVALTWSTNGVPYTNVALRRDGSFLADVTGVTTFTDMPVGSGPFSYEIEVACGVDFGPVSGCSADLLLAAPSAFECNQTPCVAEVTLAWQNQGSYDGLTLFRDGVALPGPVDPTAQTYTDDLVPAGVHEYQLIATCVLSSVVVSCEVLVVVFSGQSDLVLELEGPDDVASARAMVESLVALGREPLLVRPAPDLLALPCGIELDSFAAIWVAAGTFPFEYDLTAAEGDLLAEASLQGVDIYIEGGDLWGFAHDPSGLDARDGIEVESVLDGGDALTAMNGANATAVGLDTSDFMPAVYFQASQLENDFTDELVLTGSNPAYPIDADVLDAEVIWTNAAAATPFAAGIAAVNIAGGSVISCSWEFGGFELDPATPSASALARIDLMTRYLGFFGVPEDRPSRILRGDANQDGFVDIGDAILLLSHTFPPAPSSWQDCYPPSGIGLEDNPSPIFCLDAADANDDESLDIGDAIAVLSWLFGNSVPLAFPGPTDGCGEDPDSAACVAHHPSLPAGYRRVTFAGSGSEPVPSGCRTLTGEDLCP